jgi:hypothetical protein
MRKLLINPVDRTVPGVQQALDGRIYHPRPDWTEVPVVEQIT